MYNVGYEAEGHENEYGVDKCFADVFAPILKIFGGGGLYVAG